MLTAMPLKLAISIHALRGEGDIRFIYVDWIPILFLSTPSVGRATRGAQKSTQPPTFLSTPSVGRATRLKDFRTSSLVFLSTPSVGRATVYLDQEQANEVFLSTPSVGRATDIPIDVQIGVTTISIHALRGEGDAKTGLPFCPSIDFYPRPPWGGRPGAAAPAIL